jgi:hypothetical protein
MKNLFLLSAIAGLLISVGCTSNPPAKPTSPADPTAAAFKQFLKKFDRLSLPLRLRPSDDLTTDGLPEIDGHTIDTLFIHTPEDICWAYGLLPDTSTVYQLVWLAPADTYQPFLTTFSKTGKKISEAHIGIGGCGADCGFECSETVLINKDLSIYAADTVSTSKCDEQGNIIKGTTRKYVRFTTGNVAADGQIKMTEETEKSLDKK